MPIGSTAPELRKAEIGQPSVSPIQVVAHDALRVQQFSVGSDPKERNRLAHRLPFCGRIAGHILRQSVHYPLRQQERIFSKSTAKKPEKRGMREQFHLKRHVPENLKSERAIMKVRKNLARKWTPILHLRDLQRCHGPRSPER
jgi:hypothetical protein